MQKQQWDTLEMLEEAIRLLVSHPRFAEEPEIATLAGELASAASFLARWRCFTNNTTADCAAHSTVASEGGGEGVGEGSSSTSKLCSSLLRIISLALTVAKMAARCPASSGRWSGASFDLWRTCSGAVHAFCLPQRMQSARGITALLLHPACCGIQRALFVIAQESRASFHAAFSEGIVSSLFALLQSCSVSLPPRLSVDILTAGPALALVEQEAGRLPQQQDPTGLAVVGSGHRQQTAASAEYDGLANMICSYILSMSRSLACMVFGVPPLRAHSNTFAYDKLNEWINMAVWEPSCYREGCSLDVGEPFFSSVFLNETAPASATSELAEESVATLSRILSSPAMDRVLDYNSASAATANGWLVQVTASLCFVASILELHSAVQQLGQMGGSTPDGSTSSGGTADFAPESSVPAPLPSDPGPPAASRVSSSSSQLQEARHSIAEALRLISGDTLASRAALEWVLSNAVGQVRELLSGLVSSGAATAGGDSLGTATGTTAAGGDSLETATRTAAGVAAVAITQNRNSCLRDWELVQAELLLGLPEELWGVRPCCNTACVRLEGPCEMEVKTQACGGGCGARYCCTTCQEQAWGGGHRRNCAVMREMREQWDRANGPQVAVTATCSLD